MPFTLAYLDSSVPTIPSRPGADGIWHARPVDRLEHFGTEHAAMKRVADLLPGPDWLDLRLYGPDGRRLADQAQLAARLDAGPEIS